jgi:hypothetical protein
MMTDSGMTWILHFGAEGIALWLRIWDLISKLEPKDNKVSTGTAMADNGEYYRAAAEANEYSSFVRQAALHIFSADPEKMLV